MAVKFLVSPLFQETYSQKAVAYPRIKEVFKEFLAKKSQNPMVPFGSGDRPDKRGNFKEEVPGILHSHLTHDLSVWFTISGRDPHVIKLYGIFSHDESGTGQPPSTKIQQKLGKKMARQDFSPIS